MDNFLKTWYYNLKQDHAHRGYIMDKYVYFNRCISILRTDQFCYLNEEPSKPTESELQRSYQTIKTNLANKNIAPLP